MMLSKPNNGWSSLTVAGKSFPVSYLTCVPLDVMYAAQAYFSGTSPSFSVMFDGEEDGRYALVCFPTDTMVVSESGDVLAHEEGVGSEETARELVGDIEGDMEAWSSFLIDDDDASLASELENMVELVSDML